MRGEEWHSCIIAQGYDISNRGDVREWWRGELSFVEPYIGRDNTAWVDLLVETNQYDYDAGRWVRKVESYPVWRLMLDAWIINWQRGYHIHYLDGDVMNNSVENLRATVTTANGQERVVGVRDDGYFYSFDRRKRGRVEIVETGERFDGVKAAANHAGALISNVSHVLAGRLETTKGLHFRWVE